MPPDVTGSGSPAEWIRYAEADLELATSASPPSGFYEPLCFHAQQAVEKALKAILVKHGIEFPYTHNVQRLLDLLPAELTRTELVDRAGRVTAYAVSARYPSIDEPVTEEEYREALKISGAVVEWAKTQLAEADPSN